MRKTKIIATLGPATDSSEMIARLFDGGVNLFRLNMSHAKPEWVRRVVADIRAADRQRESAVGILMDTQGPAIRTGDVPAPIPIEPGERFFFVVRGDAPAGTKSTTVNYDDFPRDVVEGNTLLVDNGEIRMRIKSKSTTQVECEVLTPGTIGSRRHINLPGVRVSLPALTGKDREDVKLGIELGVDFIALSFVREPGDMQELRQITRNATPPPQLVAKIEHQFAVHHFEEIARASDAVMVARGDLGIECPFEELPIIQRRIVKRSIELGKPVIVATQMLESMISNPMPTRAEITDVANAVFEQADAIMLSGETTTGRYPLACVEAMDRIARRIERSGGANYQIEAELTRPREKLARSAVLLADELRAAAIVVFTRSGQMPRYVSWLRPSHSPIHVFCADEPKAQQLTLCRAVMPHVLPSCVEDPDGSVEGAVARLFAIKALKKGDTIVVVMPPRNPGDQQTDTVKMRVV